MVMKTLIVVSALALAGCSTPHVMPPDVSIMPNDCANLPSITNWLTYQLTLPKQPLERTEDYERTRSQIKARIWDIRYHCRSV